jgi:subtilisin family serine protease
MLVELRRDTAQTAVGRLRAAGATLVAPRLEIWRVPAAVAPSVVPPLVRARLTRLVEPDRALAPLGGTTSATVRPGSQWWLRTIGAAGLTPPGPGKPVTVVDTGADVNHPELEGRQIDLLNLQRGIDQPGSFHGTAVSSLIAARGVHVLGVYPRATLREWDASPTGQLTVSAIIAGINAAVEAGPGVINLSLGGPIDDPLLRQAVLDAVHEGSLVVAAQGEDRFDGSPPAFPADETHVLAVVATDRHNVVYLDSNGSESNDLSAPGVGVTVAVPPSQNPTGYQTVTGNSYAAALVSGAAAWLWTRRPDLDPAQVYRLLIGTARRIANGPFNTVSGYGLLDLRAALAAPTPPPGRYEPNDDITMVKPGGMFEAGEPFLTSSVRSRAYLRGALYSTENPRDVYRAWIPAHGSLSVTTNPLAGQISVHVWGSGTRSVFEGGTVRKRDLLASAPGPGRSRLVVSNPRGHGTIAYVEVSLGNAQDATYSLELAG